MARPTRNTRPKGTDGIEAFARYERARTAIMVGSSVKAARVRAGISQAELARRARTSQPSIARLEKGHLSPTVISLDRIAKALGAELIIDFEPVGEQSPRAAR
jgi:transcriptional regulator with XRE-family HTH domain